ncbi:MAG: glucose-6-phosphate dehydrogenase [Candidatus Puniceispirillaceae bacterium]
MAGTLHNLPQSAAIAPSDYVIFGGTGDLALRKIFPALFYRYLDGQVTQEFRLVAAARSATTKEDFVKKLRPFCEEAIAGSADNKRAFDEFTQILEMIVLDVASGAGADELKSFLQVRQSDDRPVIFYMAISPALFGASCRLLQQSGLVTPTARLVVEKPLGHDGASARKINEELRSVFDEANIYRIDHYLGKETVQNLMALRFANTIFESQWNNTFIDHIQITVAESVGLEGRASYYDKYGALRDMVQNHLMQLVCLVAMEPPAKFQADQVRDEKLRVLRALRPIEAAHLSKNLVIGQYEEGMMNGQMAPSYQSELGEPSKTDTFAALKFYIENWRWAGVPFYIRTGKRMGMRASEIIVTFKKRSHDIFSQNTEDDNNLPNQLVIRLQPQEGLRLQLVSKQPGPGGMRLFPAELNLSFGETFNTRLPDAYERLLMDVARGNQTLFMRHDEVMAAWDFMDPIIAAAADIAPEIYEAGSFGPEAQDRLFDDHEARWQAPHVYEED